MKTCSNCQTEQSELEFHWRNKNRGVRWGHCKTCTAIKNARWREDNPEKARAKDLRSRIKNREARNARNRERMRERACERLGISISAYWDMYYRQGGCCAICGRSDADRTRALAIDHDHASNRVRALLCSQCNVALGMSGDSPALLRRMADYIESHEVQAI